MTDTDVCINCGDDLTPDNRAGDDAEWCIDCLAAYTEVEEQQT
jgi:hypothetical protein